MLRSLAVSLAVALVAPPALADSVVSMPEVPAEEQAAFAPGAQHLREQSHSRACEELDAYVKKFPAGALAREGRIKRAFACSHVGRATSEMQNEWRAIAAGGPLDFPRALANTLLVQNGERWDNSGNDRARATFDMLEKVAAKSGGRWASEARAFFFALCFADMESGNGNVDQLAERVLAANPSPAEADHALYLRGRQGLYNETNLKRAEKDLAKVSQGSSEWADDALWELGQARERKGQFEAALAFYQEIIQRFSPTTSNRYGNAQSQIQEIKRPVLGVGVSYVEVPGEKTRFTLSFRNITEARLVVTRADPLHGDPERMLHGDEAARVGAPGETVKSWTESLKAPAPYAPGSKELTLELPVGAYSIVATSGELRSPASLLVSTLASVIKVGGGRAAVWTTDAFTGKAVPLAEVVLYLREDGTGDRRLEGVADDAGLCLFDLGAKRIYDLVAWSSKGGAFTAASGYAGWRDPDAGELLAYALTDRPLYKPGEKVGLKIFVRERKGGPAEAAAGVTFEARVHDPSGRELDKRQLTSNSFGTASFELSLGSDAALGQYNVSLRSQGRSLRASPGRFRVEEYKPPEYTVSVEPAGKPRPGEVAKVKIAAAFYFGGPVANAQGRAIVTENSWAHAWSAWGDEPIEESDEYGNRYGFNVGRRYREWYGSYALSPPRTLTFKTDAAGTAILEIPPLPGSAQQGDRSYSVQVFVTDASRREVTGSGSVNVSAAPFFVDLRADRLIYKPGERMKVQVRAEDANKNPESPALELRLVRLDEKGVAGEILKRPVALANGRGAVELDADALGPVRVEAHLAGTPANEVLTSTDVWLTNEAKPIVPPQAGFLLLTDNVPLKVGGTVRALVVTPQQGGHVLVTLEGDRLWSARSLEVLGRARFVELPLTGEMAPNVFLNVARLEEGTFYSTAAPIHVSGSSAALDVQVSVPTGRIEPGSTLPVTVGLGGQGAPGANAEIAVSIVDEAIFAIEPERNDLLSFFGRHAQQQAVNTNASLNQRAFRPRPSKQQPNLQPQSEPDADKAMSQIERMPIAAKAPVASAPKEKAARAEESERRMPNKDMAAPATAAAGPSASMDLASGAGGQPPAAPVKARTNFSSSAGWFPEVGGKVGAPASLKAPLPDSLTSWRVTAIATTEGAFMGIGKTSLRTEKPLMVRLQGPRFFTERDEVTLSAIVSSRLDKAATVDVSFEAPGLKPLEAAARKVEVPAGGEARVDVRWLVTDPGERKVKVTARGGGEADAMEWTLPAVVHGAAQRQAFSGRLSDRSHFVVNLPEKRNPQGTRLELTASPSLLGVMLDALPYLAQYPYGCVEQTLSRFVPAAIAAKIVNRLGATSPRVPQDLNAMVDAGLKRLYSFQHSDGGWGWWQTDATNRWMSAYAVYGLWLGKEAGLKVDESVLSRGRRYLLSHLGAARERPDEHMFMVFALATTGGAPKAALDQAFAARAQLSSRGRALLALALESAHDPRERIAVENLDDIIKAAQARADASVGEANTSWETSAAIEATAYALMAVYRHQPNAALAKPLTDFLVLRRNGGKWRNTRDTAFALFALADIAMKEEAIASSGTIAVLVNGKEVARIPYKKGGLDMPGPIVLGDEVFKPGANNVEVRRDGGGTGYWAALFDVYNQDENVKGVGGDVKISRHYTILGRPGGEKAASTMEYGMALESGERVRVDVDVTANKAVEFVMIEDLKPAGMEAVMQRSGPEVCNHACTHAELRTDRVAMFLTELSVGVKHLSYELRAEVPGKFHGLPARVEAMYAPEIKATSDEIRLEIRDAQEAGKGIATGQ